MIKMWSKPAQYHRDNQYKMHWMDIHGGTKSQRSFCHNCVIYRSIFNLLRQQTRQQIRRSDNKDRITPQTPCYTTL